MKLIFCEKYGFDEHKRKGRLSAIGLGIDEVALAEQMQRHVIHPNLEELIAQFFRILRLDDEANRVFSRGFRDDKLHQFLANYLVSMGAEFDQPQYFEQRLRMGIAHVNAGVTLVMFQVAYRILQQLLMDAVPEEAKNEALLQAFILKITTLDLIIATEVYQKYSSSSSGKVSTGPASEPASESFTESAKEYSAANQLSRGSLRKLLDNDQVNELLLTGLQQADLKQTSAESPGCIAVAKIDEIEKIEQVYGKETVAQVRMGITARLLATLRPGDGVGLVADQGFIFVLSHTTLSVAEEISKRLMSCVSQNPVSADKMTIPVTISLVLTLVDPYVESDNVESEEPHVSNRILIQHLEKQLTQIQAKGINQLALINRGLDEGKEVDGVAGC